MGSGLSGRPHDRQVAQARERFLSAPAHGAATVRGQVRDAILSSWQRSYEQRVDAAHIDLLREEPDREGLLAHAAQSVLADLNETISRDPASVIVTDPDGSVLQRMCTDHALARHLDKVQLAAGYSYAEQLVGTNGIGTALESLAPTLVSGHEHYAEDLVQLACSGVPIRHPVKGTVLGLLDITTWADVPGGLLFSLARSTAHRIEQNLLLHTDRSEQALLAQYLKTCQHTGGAVLAVGHEVVMMNEQARQSLDPADQSALLNQARDVIESNRPSTFIAELPSGTSVRLHHQPAFNDTVLAGGVLHVHTTRTPQATTPPQGAQSKRRSPVLAGSSSVWLRCCQNVESRYVNHETVVLRGEDGVGKTAMLRSVHQARDPAGHFSVLRASDSHDTDAWLETVRTEFDRSGGTLVISHIERIHPDALAGLSELLQEYGQEFGAPERPWVAATMSAEEQGELDGEHQTEIESLLLPHFMHTIEVPPLRHHIEDLQELVPRLLSTLGSQYGPTVSPEAMQQLMRVPWPGNVTQLRRVLLRLLRHHRSGTVSVDDLPPECRSTSRRQLSSIESLERDAIVNSLVVNGGDKEKAGKDLGMSRATIYRRIRRYGITM